MAGIDASGRTKIQTGKTMKVDQAPGLYVHIPFCLSRCGYCAFTSTVYDKDRADAYIEAIRHELSTRTVFNETAFPSTLFIGGGTPSVLTPAQLGRLFSYIPMPAAGGEATCEINPDSASEEKLTLLRDAGINRVSFGAQTFSEQGLRLLGRRHNAEQIERAVASASRLGFSRINIDLINGYPGQSEETLREDLRRAVELGVDHVSSYNFILEESASGYAALSALAGEEDEEWGRRCWDLTEEWLCGRGGFHHYEVSNFARSGGECAHNAAIWRGGEYLGVGASACSYLAGRRNGNTADVAAYVAGDNSEAWSECLDDDAAARECTVFWLRLYEGIDLEVFRRRTGRDFFDLYRGHAESLIAEGMMEYRDGRIRVLPEYMPVLDAVLVDLV